MNFFGWHGGGGGGVRDTLARDVSPPSRSEPDLVALSGRLQALREGPEPLALVQPFGKVLATLCQVLRYATSGSAVPAAPCLAAAGEAIAGEALEKAVAFLEPCRSPDRHLEFVLAAHTDQAATQAVLDAVEQALQELRSPPPPTSSRWSSAAPSAAPRAESQASACDAALASWRAHRPSFAKTCLEAWELHSYFVFLDIKDDRSLLQQTAHRLCQVLGLRARVLQRNFARTRPWAEETLLALSQCEQRPLFERLHEQGLRRWREDWEARLRKAPQRHRESEEAQHGTKFWESYFTVLFKITWPDFVEAFEHFYLLGRFPADLTAQLRRRVDPSSTHLVSRVTWQRLLRERSRIADIVDLLLGEVLGEISTMVYRAVPLRQRRSLATSCASGGGDDMLVVSEPSVASSGGAPGPSCGSATASAPPSSGCPNSGLSSRPLRWYPFAADDADMAVPTPHDIRLHQPSSPPEQTAAAHQQVTAWDTFVEQRCSEGRPPWEVAPEGAAGMPAPPLLQVGRSGACSSTQAPRRDDEPLRVRALRMVTSTSSYTNRALVFRVVSGDLGASQPLLELPRSTGSGGVAPAASAPAAPVAAAGDGGSTEDSASEPQLLPALVVTGNGTRFSGVTKFGRSSTRRTLLPDYPMREPIASRSHFNVVYNQDLDRYYLMDAGSKWGTWVKIGSVVTLSCGDWIRVGGVEFIIRYCGGGCACKQRHTHYRLHSLRLLRAHQGLGAASRRLPGVDADYSSHGASPSSGDEGSHQHRRRSRANSLASHPSGSCILETEAGENGYRSSGSRRETAGGDSSSEEDRAQQLEDELLVLLSSRRPRGWTSASARLCQQGAAVLGGSGSAGAAAGAAADGPCAGIECIGLDEVAMVGGAVSSSSQPSCRVAAGREHSDRSFGPSAQTSVTFDAQQATVVPIAPLELDFHSGPRCGEKLVLCERVCTLGRGEGNTIQVSDSQLASVSRVHCIFEYSGDRWHMRDNGSTNGTWRRFSCVLEPSMPVLLSDGDSIQAGVHEFVVEEAEMRQWWIPSSAQSCFDTLCDQERRELQQQRPQNPQLPIRLPPTPVMPAPSEAEHDARDVAGSDHRT